MIGRSARDEARRALHDLLLSCFKPAELRAWVSSFNSGLDAHLPGVVETLFASGVLECLIQRGLVNEAFFAALVEERPLLHEEIAAIHALRSADMPRATEVAISQVPLFEGPRGATVAALRDFTGRVGPLAELERLLQAHATVCVVACGIGVNSLDLLRHRRGVPGQ